MEEREALVLGGEFVGMVDAVVAAIAKGRFVGGAENRSLLFVTDVALDLHLLIELLQKVELNLLLCSLDYL